MTRTSQLIVAVACLLAVASACTDWSTSLTLHNQYRAKHQAPAMTWNASMASMAAAYSAKLVNSTRCWLAHSTSAERNNNGENLYAAWGSGAASCGKATTAFYNEVSQYIFSSTPWTTNQPNFGAIGHFTQLVWKNSIQLGCGSATSASGCYVITCRYAAAGNFIGDANFLANVLPAIDTPSPPPRPPSPSPKPSPPPPPPSPPTPPPRPPSPPSACADNTAYPCAWAKTNGYCTGGWYWTNGPMITVTCPVSCNTCPTGRRMALETDTTSGVVTRTQQGSRKELLRGRAAQEVTEWLVTQKESEKSEPLVVQDQVDEIEKGEPLTVEQ